LDDVANLPEPLAQSNGVDLLVVVEEVHSRGAEPVAPNTADGDFRPEATEISHQSCRVVVTGGFTGEDKDGGGSHVSDAPRWR